MSHGSACLLACVGLSLLAGCTPSNASRAAAPTAPTPAQSAPRRVPASAPATPPPTTVYPKRMPVASTPFTTQDAALERVLADAGSQGRPALLFFTADWCGFCFKLEQQTLTRPEVQQAIRAGFVPVVYDVDKELGRSLSHRYGARGFPTMVIVDAAGDEQGRIVGFRSPTDLIRELGRYR